MNKHVGKRKRNSSNFKILRDFSQIEEAMDILERQEVKRELDHTKEYLYIEKVLTFADIPTYGKYGYDETDKVKRGAFSEEKICERADKNYLFYSDRSEIAAYERKNKKQKIFFCETKQSNISLPLAFYEFLGLKGGSRKNIGTVLSEGKYTTFLVADCLKGCFEKNITDETFEKLGRAKQAKDISIDTEDEYIKIDLHIAVHGIGTKKDKLFHDLRGNVFAKDKMCILAEKSNDGHYRLFIMLYRNPKFYVLNHRLMPAFLLSSYKDEEDEKTVESRKGQARWRNMLAEYALTLSVEDTSKVICPFTHTEVAYPAEATLLRASHIKAYAKCRNADDTINTEEAYDIDNGFLVTANVDALFDKYLISVKPDGTVVISKTISDTLIEKLDIAKRIDSKYITEKKKEYLKVHYETFLEREEKQK